MPRRNPNKLYERRCGACRADFETTRKKATRCPECIAAGRRVHYREYFECTNRFIVFDDTHINCPSCAEIYGIDQSEPSPAQVERFREAERVKRFLEGRDRLLDWLKTRKTPTNPRRETVANLGLI